MIKIFKLGIITLTLTTLSVMASSEIDSAMKYGELLTTAVQEKSYTKLKKLNNYKAIRKYLSKNKCSDFKYKAYIVGSENNQYLYLIASKGKHIIIGRHFKSKIEDGNISIESFTSSTNGCLDLGVPKSDIAGMYATHLKLYPNEFHILQSNLGSIDLFIGTSAGMYIIKNGSITLADSD